MTGLTAIVYICLEQTFIVLRNNICISIETQIRTQNSVRILILLSQQLRNDGVLGLFCAHCLG